MNYEVVYKTLETKLTALVPNASVRLPNRPPADDTDFDIDVSVSEIGSTIHTEASTKRDVSINLLLSVPVSIGTESIHNISSRIVTALSPQQATPLTPIQKGDFWAGKYFVRINSASSKQQNITDTRCRINVRISATIYT